MIGCERRRRPRAAGAVLGLALLALLIASASGAPPASDQPLIARVTIRTPSDLARFMGLGLDVLEAREGDDLFILTTQAEVDRLQADGWPVVVDPDHTSRLQQQQQELRRRAAPQLQQPLFMGGYRAVPEVRAALEDAAEQYPDLAEVFAYGTSWERLTGGAAAGHDLFGIRLTNRQRPGPKPTFFLMAAIHARELTTPELALRFVDHLLGGYGIDADVTWLLDEHLIVVVPVVNPDGHVLAEQGYLQRKNTDTSHGTCSVPNIGVDLNRNSPFRWGVVDGPTESPCAETYPGPVPESEPETAALQALVRSLFPDQRGPGDGDASPSDATGVLVTLHSYGNLVMWPWGFTSASAPNVAGLSAIGRKLAAYNGYTPQQSIALYPTSGTTDDWAYGELGIAAFTFEVGPSSGSCGGFFPAFTCLDGGTGGAFWLRNLPAFLYAARIARAPFELAQGPTAEAATAALLADNRIEVQVRLDERANGGQVVTAAEYYLDAPPWGGGTALAMTAVDGAFDATVELATAIVGPFAERHQIFVRGRDASGAWGPVRAIFTPDPSCGAALSPTTQSVAEGGGAGSVALAIPDGCAWTADTVDTWLTVTGTAGIGSGAVSYQVSPNTGTAPRTGTVVIAGQRFTIDQAGQSPPDLRVTAVGDPPAAAGPGTSFSVAVTVENAGGVTSPASTTRFYLSTDLLKDGGDRLLGGSRAVPSLAAGGASSGPATLTIPSATPLGTYHLIACADDTGAVAESDEQNNCRATSATVRVTRADLVQTAVAASPSVVAPGATVSITDTVLNQGAVASGASTTRYYLSSDPQRGGDTLLSGSRAVAALAPGASAPGAVSLAIPTTTALGAYHVLACADDLGAVAETDETNNCAATGSAIQVTRPDLVVTAVSSPQGAAAPGSAFGISDTVLNQGALPSAASTTRYYLSHDLQKGAGDILLSGARTVPPLAAGASFPGAAVAVTIPAATPLGAYHVLACADDVGALVEVDETNNCRASATTVQVTRPDLVVTAIADPPAAAAPGSTFKIADTVQNQGALAAAASYTRFYLSLDGQKGASDVLLSGSRAVPGLAAGASSAGALLNVAIPATTPLDTYYVLACADDTALVVETDDTNNCRSSATRLQVTRADLVETAVSNPLATARRGTSFMVTDTVANVGALASTASTTRYYLSLDQVRGTGDILLGGGRSVPALAPGASSPGAPVAVSIPSSTPFASYYLLACADDARAVIETDEANCLASSTQVGVTP